MNNLLLVLIACLAVWVIIDKILQKRNDRRNRAALDKCLEAVKNTLQQEAANYSDVSGYWFRGYPRAILLFSSEQDVQTAKDEGLINKVAEVIVDLVRNNPAYGFNRHSFDKERAVFVAVKPFHTHLAPQVRFWWEQDLVGETAIPIGPEIQELIDRLVDENKHAEVSTMLLNDCGANIALPWTLYETVAEVEEAVRFMRFGVLFTSGGDVNKLADLLRIVSEDYRELPGWGRIDRKYKKWLRERDLS